MKLYHGTNSKNVKRIIKNGLKPSNCKKMNYVDQQQYNTLQGKNLRGIYGFTDINDAILFAKDNGGEPVVVEFETNGETVMDDPEYIDCKWIDGQAKFVVTQKAIEAKLVWSMYEN